MGHLVRMKSRLRSVEAAAIKDTLNLPSRGPNAYALFLAERYPTLRQQNPAASMVEVSKQAGEQWRNLSVADKQSYQARARQSADLYQRQMADQPKTPLSAALQTLLKTNNKAYEEMSDERARLVRASMRAYRQAVGEDVPKTGKGLFLGERLQGRKFGESKGVFGEWQALPADVKAQYEQRAAQQFASFKQRLRQLIQSPQ